MYDLSGDKYADVIIHQFHTGSRHITSLDKLADENDNNKNPVIISQPELSGKYK